MQHPIYLLIKFRRTAVTSKQKRLETDTHLSKAWFNESSDTGIIVRLNDRKYDSFDDTLEHSFINLSKAFLKTVKIVF